MSRAARKLAESNTHLAHELSQHARRARGVIRFQRVLEALPQALADGMPLLFVAPAAYLLFRILLMMSAPIDPPAGFGLAVIGLLAPYTLYTLSQVIAAAGVGIKKTEALAHVDHQLGLKDRLQTAAEFLAQDKCTPFMVAAIDDAAKKSTDALAEHLSVAPRVEVPASRAWLFPIAGALLVVIGVLLPVAGSPRKKIGPISTETAEVKPGEAQTENPRPVWSAPATMPKDPAKTEAGAKSKASVGAEGSIDSKDQKMKAGSGKTKAGKAAPVGAPSGAAQAKGHPSDEGKAAQSKRSSRKKSKPRKPKDGNRKPEPSKKSKSDRPSGTTMGRGSGRGSSKNPVSSEWSSKDQMPHDDEEPEDDDEDVEDENENSEARGGVQPNLRDRRPPASRDLGISFGNRPGGDGRGGPSQRKKSRGTASLVLGVPIPDHVKGQMNPGTTKITQERIEPKKEESKGIAAADRRARVGHAGPTVAPRTDRTLNQLIESYFRARRAAFQKDEN